MRPPSGTELPIACTLQPDELVARGELLGELTRDALLGRARRSSAVELRFRSDHAVQAALERFIELEQECCPFLQFGLSRQSGELVLGIEGPPAAEPVLSALYEATGTQAVQS
jgi:hypothetical protein